MAPINTALILCSIAGVAILLQIIGFAVPAWLVYDFAMGSGDGGSNPSSDNIGGMGKMAGNVDNSNDFGNMGSLGSSVMDDASDTASDLSNMGSSMDGMSEGSESGFKNMENSVHQESSGLDMSGLGQLGVSGMSFKIGLWVARACVKMAGVETCQSVSLTKVQSAIDEQDSMSKAAANAFFGDFASIQGLATCALISAVAGGVVMFIFLRADASKGFVWKGVLSASLWGLSVIFLIPTIVLAAEKTKDLGTASDMMKSLSGLGSGIGIVVHTPWALILSGLGGFFSVVLAVLIALHVCHNKDREVLPGTWFRFTEKA